MERPIDGPEPWKPYLTSTEAGVWIGGFKEDLFESLMAEHLPTVQPVYMGKYKYWPWMDVAALAYILKRAETSPPKAKKTAKNASEAPESEED